MKKLKRYEKEYFTRRAEEEQKQTPLQRLEVNKHHLFYFYFYILSFKDRKQTFN